VEETLQSLLLQVKKQRRYLNGSQNMQALRKLLNLHGNGIKTIQMDMQNKQYKKQVNSR